MGVSHECCVGCGWRGEVVAERGGGKSAGMLACHLTWQEMVGAVAPAVCLAVDCSVPSGYWTALTDQDRTAKPPALTSNIALALRTLVRHPPCNGTQSGRRGVRQGAAEGFGQMVHTRVKAAVLAPATDAVSSHTAFRQYAPWPPLPLETISTIVLNLT